VSYVHHVVGSIRSLLERIGILRSDAGDPVARAAAAQATLIAASRPETPHRSRPTADVRPPRMLAPRTWP
jgi:hypothetical protein